MPALRPGAHPQHRCARSTTELAPVPAHSRSRRALLPSPGCPLLLLPAGLCGQGSLTHRTRPAGSCRLGTRIYCSAAVGLGPAAQAEGGEIPSFPPRLNGAVPPAHPAKVLLHPWLLSSSSGLLFAFHSQPGGSGVLAAVSKAVGTQPRSHTSSSERDGCSVAARKSGASWCQPGCVWKGGAGGPLPNATATCVGTGIPAWHSPAAPTSHTSSPAWPLPGTPAPSNGGFRHPQGPGLHGCQLISCSSPACIARRATKAMHGILPGCAP